MEMVYSDLFCGRISTAFIGDRRDAFLASFDDELVLRLNLVKVVPCTLTKHRSIANKSVIDDTGLVGCLGNDKIY